MNYKEFLDRVSDDLQRELPGAQVSVTTVQKLQGESYQGITIMQDGSAAAPSINLQYAYEEVQRGTPYWDILSEIVAMAGEALEKGRGLDPERIQNYAAAKELLTLSLVPVRGNEEMLKDLPHKEIEDLAVIYRAELSPGATVVINNSLLQNYGITADQLHEDALINSQEKAPASVRPMFEVLGVPEELAPEGPPALYVATTASGHLGAGVIAYPGVMEQAAEKLGGDFFVLPSSIHEVLLVRANDPEEYHSLEAMVRQINEAEVAPADRLSDRVYHYDSKEHMFELAEKFAERSREKTAERGGLDKLKEKKAEAALQPKHSSSGRGREALAL